MNTVSSSPDPLVSTDSTADSDSPSGPPESNRNAVQAVLEKLFELYPHLFGAEFRPLKLGVFQELMSRHPGEFKRDSLKAALGFHTRSTRYLQCVASGIKRHDLDGQAVDSVAPEHVYLALIELFRRRQTRSREDLRPKLKAQLIAAFDASGLSRQEYLACLPHRDDEISKLLEDALAEHAEKMARQDALVRAFESSGKTPAKFADMYGITARDLQAALTRPRRTETQTASQ
jgi:ProP effector